MITAILVTYGVHTFGGEPPNNRVISKEELRRDEQGSLGTSHSPDYDDMIMTGGVA